MSVTLTTITKYEKASPYCSEFNAVYNAFGTKPTETYAGYMDEMVRDLVTLGYWARMDLFYVLASNTSDNAKINWINPGTYNITDPGSTNPTFTEYEGFNGDASSDYLSTNYTPSSHANKMSLEDGTLGVYVLTDTESTAQYSVGITDTSPSQTRIAYNPEYGGGAPRGYMNDNTSTAGTIVGSTTGLHCITRRDNTEKEYYHRGSPIGTVSCAAVALPDYPIIILAVSANGTASSFDNRQIALVFLGDGITDQEAADIEDIIETYMTNLGIGI